MAHEFQPFDLIFLVTLLLQPFPSYTLPPKFQSFAAFPHHILTRSPLVVS